MSAEANFVKIPRGESTCMENLKPVWIPGQVAECLEHSLLMIQVRGSTLAPPINMASLSGCLLAPPSWLTLSPLVWGLGSAPKKETCFNWRVVFEHLSRKQTVSTEQPFLLSKSSYYDTKIFQIESAWVGNPWPHTWVSKSSFQMSTIFLWLIESTLPIKKTITDDNTRKHSFFPSFLTLHPLTP